MHGHRPPLQYIAMAVAMLLIVTLWLLPYGIERGALSWLQDHGVKHPTIEHVGLNLFSGKAEIKGLKSGDGLNINSLTLDFDWLPLWQHIVHIHSLKLSQSNLKLLQDKGMWQVMGIAFAVSDSTAQPETTAEHTGWQLIVDELVLDTVQLNLKNQQFELSLPLQSMRFSLSSPAQQHQRIRNTLELGKTDFSGFGYRIHFDKLHIAAELELSMLADDILASISSKHLSLALQGVDLQREQEQLHADSLKLKAMVITDKEQLHIAELNARGLHGNHAFGQAGTLQLAAALLRDIDIKLNDTAGLEQLKLGTAELTQLQAKGLNHHNTQQITLAAVQLDKLKLQANGQLKVQHISLQQLAAKQLLQPEDRLQAEQLSLQQLHIDKKGGIHIASASLKSLQGDHISSRNQHLQLADGTLSGLSISPENNITLQQVEIESASLSSIKADIKKATESPPPTPLLAAVKHAKLQRLQFQADHSGSFASLLLNELQLPSRQHTTSASAASLLASQAQLSSAGNISFKAVKLDRLHVQLRRQKNGNWAQPDLLTGQPTAARQPSSKQTPAPVVIIEQLQLGRGSQVKISDASVSPAFNTTLQLESFQLAPLDSSGKQPGQLTMQWRVGQSGSLQANGKIQLPAEKALQMKMHVELKNIDLPHLSAYIEPELGKSIKTGQFNLESELRMADNSVDASNKVLIRKLELAAPTQNNAQKISLAGGMSIDMALNMLRDGDGDIALEIPVHGPLNDPDIKLGNIINKALLSSLTTGALTYATLALQPYGSIVFAANVAGGLIKDAMKPTLTAITFAERSSELSIDMKAYISKIAGLMQQKDFRLQVCGWATQIEAEPVMQPDAGNGIIVGKAALNKRQLLDLAQARSDTVIASLHQHSIASERLFNCSPAIDAAAMQAQPRVELLLD